MHYKNKKHHIKIHKKRNPFSLLKEKLKKKRMIAKHRRFIYKIKITNGCKYCEETSPACLEFHHRKKEEKENIISVLVKKGYAFKTIRKELLKCDLVCSNCHSKIHDCEKRNVVFKPKLIKNQNFNLS